MKEFYLINGINTAAEDFKKEGYTVINFGQVKSKIMEVLKDRETADKFHRYNYPFTTDNPELNEIHHKLQSIVFKESRGNSQSRAIGWENGNSFLRYHSGIIYKWFLR